MGKVRCFWNNLKKKFTQHYSNKQKRVNTPSSLENVVATSSPLYKDVDEHSIHCLDPNQILRMLQLCLTHPSTRCDSDEWVYLWCLYMERTRKKNGPHVTPKTRALCQDALRYGNNRYLDTLSYTLHLGHDDEHHEGSSSLIEYVVTYIISFMDDCLYTKNTWYRL